MIVGVAWFVLINFNQKPLWCSISRHNNNELNGGDGGHGQSDNGAADK
jgi:hypothetical protein